MNVRLLPLLGLLLAAACKEPPRPTPSPPPAPGPAASAQHYLGDRPDGKLHVYFLDVGQGDAALIVSPEGRTVLVDTGPASAANHLVNRLPELLARPLDLVVLTHPAADHYGALDAVQKVAAPRRLLEPQLPEASSEYDALLTSIGSRGVEIFSPAPNPSQPEEHLRLPLGGGAELTVLWPRAPSEPLLLEGPRETRQAQHEANSIVLRLTHGETSVLFAGDARLETEAALLNRSAELGSTLLKVGAHGAETGTTPEFLQRVRPRAAIISAGASTTLGMPAQATLERLNAAHARIFRTDEAGEVHALSDGKRFVLTTQRLAPGEPSNTQHVFDSAEEDLPPFLPIAPPPAIAQQEPPGAVPTKTAGVKAESDIDLSRSKQVEEPPSRSGNERGARTAKKQPAASGVKYYASRNRPIFHREDCPSVKRIFPENLITYTSRDEALKQRKPAHCCNP
ncbi:MAG: MBL fold metallo-hydrolase [Myxococcaceae bacterium]|nr:MBL fold metallo-hydrolase [Myxococcaceae bacterium]